MKKTSIILAFCIFLASGPLKSEILSYDYLEIAFGAYDGASDLDFWDTTPFGFDLQGSTYINNIDCCLPSQLFIQGGIKHLNSSDKNVYTQAHVILGYDQYLSNRASLWLGAGLSYQAYQYVLFQREVLDVVPIDSNTESILSDWNMTHVINERTLSATFRSGLRYQASRNVELAGSFRFNSDKLEELGYSLDVKYNTLYDIYLLGRFDRIETHSGLMVGLGKYF